MYVQRKSVKKIKKIADEQSTLTIEDIVLIKQITITQKSKKLLIRIVVEQINQILESRIN